MCMYGIYVGDSIAILNISYIYVCTENSFRVRRRENVFYK